MIEVKEITKQYGKKIVLDGVDLQFPKGKVTSLIGSNGAGKVHFYQLSADYFLKMAEL